VILSPIDKQDGLVDATIITVLLSTHRHLVMDDPLQGNRKSAEQANAVGRLPLLVSASNDNITADPSLDRMALDNTGSGNCALAETILRDRWSLA